MDGQLTREEVYSPPSVEEAMSFGAFSAASLVAGGGGLQRRIEWVRVMETPETVRRMRPRELLLTTAYPIRHDRDAQVRLIAEMAEIEAAGLVVKLGLYLDELPEGMAAEADRHALPLFTLPRDIPWPDLMDPLLERIINAEHWRLKRSLDIHRRFADLVLDGKGVNEICRTLAELLDGAVTIEDATFHLLAHTGDAHPDPHRRETIARQGTPRRVLFDPQIQALLRDLERRRAPVKVPPFPHVGMQSERIVTPILAANQVLGYITVIDNPPHSEELAFMAIEQAALVAAMALTKEREVAEVEGRVRGDYLDELIHATYGDEATAQRRARHLGYPQQGLHVLVVVDIDDFRGFLEGQQLSEDAIQALKREYLRRVSAVVRAAHHNALLQLSSDSVLALLPIGTEDVPAGHPHALGVQIQEAIGAWKPGFTVSIGYSAAVGMPAGIATAHREVRGVLDTLARFRRQGQVVAASELGLTGLLAGVDDERLIAFAARHLGALVDHDRARRGPLLSTLRAFLETGEQQAAARQLRVHPNTLRYRLDRIREVTHCDLDDPETRLNLSVALRVHDLLGDE